MIAELASRLGSGVRFDSDPDAVFEELRHASAAGVADGAGVTWERVDAEGGVFWPCPDADRAGMPRLFETSFAVPPYLPSHFGRRSGPLPTRAARLLSRLIRLSPTGKLWSRVRRVKFWARIFGAGFAAAALVGAAQLGVVYGLDALQLDRSFAGSHNEWSLNLTWIAWFTLVAVVSGGAYAAGQARLATQRVGVPVRLVAGFAAGLGGVAAMLPLTGYPAVNAKLDQPLHPALTVSITVCGAAAAGVLLAALIAANPPLTTNVALISLAMWVLAAASLAEATPVLGRLYLEPVRLGVLDVSTLLDQERARYTLPVLAFVIGLVTAIAGRVKNRSRVLIGVSGTTGPLLVAIAYLLAGPGISRDVTSQADAYVGAMLAVVAGLVPSAIIALLPKRQPATGR